MASDTLKSIKKVDNKKKPEKKKKQNIFKRAQRSIKDIVAELKRVTWPTRQELIKSTVSVIVFVLIMSAFTGGLDFVFSNIMKIVVG